MREVASFASGGRDSVVNLWTGTGSCVGSVSHHRQGVHYLSDINLVRYLSRGGGSARGGSGAKSGGQRRAIPTMFSIGGEGAVKLWDLRRFKSMGGFDVYSSNATNAARAVDSASGPGKLPPARGVWADQGIVSAHGKEGNVTLWTMEGGSGKEAGTWVCRCLAQQGSACTDLLSTDSFVAASSKSGSILRWAPF